MDFKKLISSLTGKEILQSMIVGIQKEHLVVDMDTFWKKSGETYIGCATTLAIIELTGVNFKQKDLDSFNKRAELLGLKEKTGDFDFFVRVQFAIDGLRRGRIDDYNRYARHIGVCQLPENSNLPELKNKNYKKDLVHYIKYHNSLIQ